MAIKFEQLTQHGHAAALEKLRTETETALAIERALNQTAKSVNDELIAAQFQQLAFSAEQSKLELKCALVATIAQTCTRGSLVPFMACRRLLLLLLHRRSLASARCWGLSRCKSIGSVACWNGARDSYLYPPSTTRRWRLPIGDDSCAAIPRLAVLIALQGAFSLGVPLFFAYLPQRAAACCVCIRGVTVGVGTAVRAVW